MRDFIKIKTVKGKTVGLRIPAAVARRSGLEREVGLEYKDGRISLWNATGFDRSFSTLDTATVSVDGKDSRTVGCGAWLRAVLPDVQGEIVSGTETVGLFVVGAEDLPNPETGGAAQAPLLVVEVPEDQRPDRRPTDMSMSIHEDPDVDRGTIVVISGSDGTTTHRAPPSPDPKVAP